MKEKKENQDTRLDHNFNFLACTNQNLILIFYIKLKLLSTTVLVDQMGADAKGEDVEVANS